jgi:hypothetical protein
MEPKREGNRTANLEITTGGAPVTVPLIGTGTNAGGQTFGNATYYTCSAGGRGGWPVAIALVALARRRRSGRYTRSTHTSSPTSVIG